MKFLIVLLLGITALPSSARAEEGEEEFVSSRLWHLAALPAWHMLWVNIHEGSHILMAMSYDYEITSYKPYPHFASDRFAFGSFSAQCPGTWSKDWQFIPKSPNQRCIPQGGEAEIAIAPSVTDIGIFAISDALLGFGVVSTDSLSGRLLYVGGMVAPWLDLAYGTNLYWSKTTDHAHFTEAMGWPRWSVFLAGNTFVALGAWRLYVQGKEVFYDRKKKPESQKVMLMPFASPDSSGMTLSLTW